MSKIVQFGAAKNCSAINHYHIMLFDVVFSVFLGVVVALWLILLQEQEVVDVHTVAYGGVHNYVNWTYNHIPRMDPKGIDPRKVTPKKIEK